MGLQEGDVSSGRKINGRCLCEFKAPMGVEDSQSRLRVWVGVGRLWLSRNGVLMGECDSRPQAMRMLGTIFFSAERLPDRFHSVAICRKSWCLCRFWKILHFVCDVNQREEAGGGGV